jgi:hypothetical protein
MNNQKINWALLIIGGTVVAIICVFVFFIFAGGETVSKNNTIDRSQIKDVYAEQIINSYNQKGIRVHAAFEVDNRSGILCVILVLFFDASGNPITGYNDGSPIQNPGQASVGQEFTPNLSHVEASKMFFVSAEALHLENGNSPIKYQVEIREVSSGALIAKSELYSFTITE